jgi:predicted transcriptional regulator
MTTTVQIKTDLWKQFAALARQQKRQPDYLLEKLVAEYLAIQNDLKLDEAIRQQAKQTGYPERDAVELVKKYRQTKTI